MSLVESMKIKEANLQYTMTIVNKIGDLLTSHGEKKTLPQDPSWLVHGEWDNSLGDMPALQKLSNAFNLSPFEQSILLICAGMEVAPRWGQLCHQTSINLPYPTLGLAQKLFSNQDWAAYLPNAPIRYWGMVKLAPEQPLFEASLRIDERILHYLLGYEYLEKSLDDITVPVAPHAFLVDSYQQQVRAIIDLWGEVKPGNPWPIVQLHGSDTISQRMVAIAAANKLEYSVHLLSEEALSLKDYDICAIIRCWQREFRLKHRLLIIHWDKSFDEASRYHRAVRLILESASFPIILISRELQSFLSQKVISFFIGIPDRQEQISLWLSYGWDAISVDKVEYSRSIESVVDQFNLSTHSIEAASARAHSAISLSNADDDNLEKKQRLAYPKVWEACRLQSRQGMDQLAERLSSNLSLDDLILPAKQKDKVVER